MLNFDLVGCVSETVNMVPESLPAGSEGDRRRFKK